MYLVCFEGNFTAGNRLTFQYIFSRLTYKFAIVSNEFTVKVLKTYWNCILYSVTGQRKRDDNGFRLWRDKCELDIQFSSLEVYLVCRSGRPTDLICHIDHHITLTHFCKAVRNAFFMLISRAHLRQFKISWVHRGRILYAHL